MNPVELIIKKRNRNSLSEQEIETFISDYVAGKIKDYQMSAFLMAIFLNGMERHEIVALTRAMMNSGTVLNLSEIPGFKVDKHSTGGVGDKVSIILAPIVAAAGVPVPMISGRGLGHTGGTLDKLESIPGFSTNLNLDRYRSQLKELGAVLIGQTADLAPADKEMYALRDVTGTVESIPLISASIMSKKMAEGIDGLVLDVKTGSGAFMKTLEDSRALANSLVSIGQGFNKKVVAYITNMNEPLGFEIGNWLETRECIECLQGKDVSDLMELTHVLCGTMIWMGGKAESVEHGIDVSKQMISSGKAFDKLVEIVKAQHGDVEFIHHPEKRGMAPVLFEITATDSGYFSEINTTEVGMTGILIGAGRMRKEDIISPLNGITIHKKLGDKITSGEKLFTVHCDPHHNKNEITQRLLHSIKLSASEPKILPIILERIDG